MPIGLSVPVYVNKGGGAQMQKEENQLDKLVVLALQEGEDDNPFQELGLDPRIIYRVNDDAAKFDARDDIENILKSFKNRLELGPDGVVINKEDNTQQTEEGELHVSFEYINLDVNEAKEFAAPFEELGDK